VTAIPLYVSGKGMHATQATWEFKTLVITFLERSGLGYDTRFRYYQELLEEPDSGRLAQIICDPVEYFDPDWPAYWQNRRQGRDKDTVITEFMLQLDSRFRRQARGAIMCYDEAGVGTGINTMRFLSQGKPILGFYNPALRKRGINLHNILQLPLEYPALVSLVSYDSPATIEEAVERWVKGLTGSG